MADFTNKHKLPPEVVAAIMMDRYTVEGEAPSDYSATKITAPIMQTELYRRHKEKLIVRDVIDNFWSFIGTITHSVLEEGWHKDMGSVIEERLYQEVRGVTISGKVDCYNKPEIRDYKTTKVYKIMRGDYTEWEQQLNVYAWFCRKNNLPVNKMTVIAFLFDWKQHETFKTNYPKAPIVVIPITLWSEEAQDEYVDGRIRDLLHAKTIECEETLASIYGCSAKEMWQDFKDFAIFKDGAKKATKCFQCGEEARKHYEEKGYGSEYQILERYSDRKRCLGWCDVAHICVQNRRLLIEEGVNPDELFSTPVF